MTTPCSQRCVTPTSPFPASVCRRVPPPHQRRRLTTEVAHAAGYEWTGREVKALREAVRMSPKEFAEKLRVSDRIVSRWEADGERATRRMVNQAALDTLLAKADKDSQGRFVGILSVDDVPSHAIIEPDTDYTSSGDYV
nr:helix-turn-helix transcriptional regulator [Streptomyces iakyrus]